LNGDTPGNVNVAHMRERRNYKKNLDVGENIDVGYLKIII